MTDIQKLLRIYLADSGIRVMAASARSGCV